MNKVMIVDASESDRRLISGLLMRAGYEPIAVGCMEVAKDEKTIAYLHFVISIIFLVCHKVKTLSSAA